MMQTFIISTFCFFALFSASLICLISSFPLNLLLPSFILVYVVLLYSTLHLQKHLVWLSNKLSGTYFRKNDQKMPNEIFKKMTTNLETSKCKFVHTSTSELGTWNLTVASRFDYIKYSNKLPPYVEMFHFFP